MANTSAINDILDKINKLSLKDQILLKKELQKKAKKNLTKLMDEIGKDNEQYTEEEVMADIDKAVKEVRYGRAEKN